MDLNIRKIELEDDILIAVSDLIKQFESETGKSVKKIDFGFLKVAVGRDSAFTPDNVHVTLKEKDVS